MKAAGSSTNALASEWPVKDNGNKHFAAIFLDEGRSAGLHLLKDRNCLVFTQGVLPFLQGSLCQGARLWWDILSRWRPQREDERTVRERGGWQVCDSSYCTANVTLFYFIGRG